MNSLPTGINGDSEGFGITFLEANACAKPVVGTNVGGISDAIDNGLNGLLVEPNNAKATFSAQKSPNCQNDTTKSDFFTPSTPHRF